MFPKKTRYDCELSNLHEVSRWGVVPLGAGLKIAVWNLLKQIKRQGAF